MSVGWNAEDSAGPQADSDTPEVGGICLITAELYGIGGTVFDLLRLLEWQSDIKSQESEQTRTQVRTPHFDEKEGAIFGPNFLPTRANQQVANQQINPGK